ncbi:uncharacterized protein LOC125649847 isoform X2 [Ostrea edulis]|nr:uncharacterized protein LOC125649847 isoform X2 [Ostrea edulis]
MDLFPPKCFPIKYWKENTQKQVLAGLGSNRNIDITDVKDRKFSSQHVPCESKRYSASAPALPLGLSPDRVPYPFEDRVTKGMQTQLQEVNNFCHKLKMMRAGLKKTRNTRMQSAFKDVVNQLENLDTKSLDVPMWLDDLVKLYEKVKDIEQVLNYNSQYTGGCLASVGARTEGENGTVICPADHNFNRAALIEFSTNPQVKLIQKNTIELGYEIHQLQSKRCRDSDYCVIRGGSVCELINLKGSSEGIPRTMCSIAKEHFSDESPTSVDLSVYIPSECVVSTNQGNIYIWSAEKSKNLVRQNLMTRFPAHESWRQALFGSHPRHVVIADCTTVQVHDIRGQYSSNVDLFALPNKFLHPKERICLVEKHPSSHHAYLTATDYSLFLLDDRFPGHPMLQWKHMLRKPPQLASSVVMDTDNILLAMGTLSPAEVCAYQYRYGFSELPQSIGSPWKFSSIGDFTEWPDMCNPLHKYASDLRLSMSLTGISLINTAQGFLFLQLDSQGELYFQEFKTSKETEDLTFCAGPLSGDLSVEKELVQRGKKWTEDLHEYVNCCKKSIKNVNVTDFFSEITLSKPGHVSCSLCMLDTCSLKLTIHSRALCYSCLHEVNEAQRIAESQYNNIVSIEDLKVSDDVEDSGGERDALSEILLHQWNEEEETEECEEKFKQLLLRRDEEIKERRKSKKTSSKTLEKRLSELEVGNVLPSSDMPTAGTEWVTDNRQLENVGQAGSDVSGCDVERNEESSVWRSYREEDYSDGRISEQDSLVKDQNEPEQVQSHLKEERADFDNGQDTPGLFISQIEKDYPFMKMSPQTRKNYYTSDHVSNVSSISLRSDGFLSTPTRLLSLHSPIRNRDRRLTGRSENGAQDSNQSIKNPGAGTMCSSPKLSISSRKRTRHSSISSSCSKQSVKSNISIQSDGFRSTPSRMHILHSPAKQSRFISSSKGSSTSSLSDWNCSMDLFDSSLKTFDLLQSPEVVRQIAPSQAGSQSQPDSKTKVKKQLMSGF